jgi:hypothetical protein
MKEGIDIRNEELLLLNLCRLSFNNDQKAKISKLAAGLSDWEHFASLANEHGVVALVYHNLEKPDLLPLVPEKIASDLGNKLMVSLSRNAFHTSVILEVIRMFNGHNIRIVLLKGLALELSVYGNSGLRQMTDIDILIDRNSFKKARKILMDNGYESLPVKSLFHKPIIAYSGKHLPSLLKNGASIDIHLELFAGRKNNLTKLFFENSAEIRINDQVVHNPPPQLFFLYLIKHLWSHELSNESQLRLYTDLVVLLEKHYNEIINEELPALASDAGLSEILANKLELLRELWELSFPGWVNDFIEKWHTPDSFDRFVFFLRSPKMNVTSGSEIVYRKTLREIPGLHRRILYVLGDLFPTLTFMKERYHCNSKLKAVLYYPHRFGKIVWLLRRD